MVDKTSTSRFYVMLYFKAVLKGLCFAFFAMCLVTYTNKYMEYNIMLYLCA